MSKARGPAFYALRGGGWRDWWTLLHPPYTAWNLSYVAIGASVAPSFHLGRLLSELGAFFLGLGVAAHALDELKDRPLRTAISDRSLNVATFFALIGACLLGATGLHDVGPALIVFIVAGVALVLAYNLEWFSGAIHNDVGFGLAWGAFPVLAGYFVQAKSIGLVAAFVAVFAYLLSRAQRALSSPARRLRRSVTSLRGQLTLEDGSVEYFEEEMLLVPLDKALGWMSGAMVALATGLVLYRALG